MAADVKQLQRATQAGDGRVRAQHGSQRRAVDVRDVADIEDQFYMALLDQPLKGGIEDGRSVGERHTSADLNQRNV